MENANGVIKKLTSAECSYYTAADILENGLLLRNISKMYCQSAKICYNKGVATFWQQKISKPE